MGAGGGGEGRSEVSTRDVRRDERFRAEATTSADGPAPIVVDVGIVAEEVGGAGPRPTAGRVLVLLRSGRGREMAAGPGRWPAASELPIGVEVAVVVGKAIEEEDEVPSAGLAGRELDRDLRGTRRVDDDEHDGELGRTAG